MNQLILYYDMMIVYWLNGCGNINSLFQVNKYISIYKTESFLEMKVREKKQ